MDSLVQPTTGRYFWSLSSAQALQQNAATPEGLTTAEATKRLRRYGANAIQAKKTAPALLLFLRQFKSPITLLLIIAALLSASLGDYTDAFIILVIIFISSLLGFWQEKGATNAVNELLKMVQIKCALLRDGKEQELPVETVVPGDVVILNAGDVIPADSLLLETQDLYIDEAAFTGETFPVQKTVGVVDNDAPLSKRSNAVFMGS
ncbi:MAG TPA: cation-transporting P-type ATPase, partial [Flavisolibacter sp.]|nr:cation-transporting P-type ATPase [Flavisolibacter sp.]